MWFFGAISEAAGFACGLLHKHRLAAAAFLVAVAWCPGIFSYASMPRWWVLAVAIPLAADLDPRKLIATPAGACFAAGLIWAAIGLAWAPIPRDGLLDWYFLALAALSMTAAIERPEAVDGALAAFGWGLALSSVIALAQRLGWSSPWLPGSGPAGLFLNSEVLAEAAAPIAVWAAWSKRWTLAAFAAVPLAVCGSRVALLAAAAGLLCAWRAPKVIKACIAIAVLLVGAAALVAMGENKIGSAGTRIVLWLAAVESIVPFGHGIGWWASAHPNPMETFAHSDALQLAVDLGIGALPFLAIPFLALKGGGDGAQRAGFVAVAVEAAISFPLHVPAGAFVAGLLAGALAVRWNPVRWVRFCGRAAHLRDFRRQATQGIGLDRGSAIGPRLVSSRPQPSAHLGSDDRTRRAGGA